MVTYRGASEKPLDIDNVINSGIDFKLVFISGYSFLNNDSRIMMLKLLRSLSSPKMIDLGISLASRGRDFLYNLKGYFDIVSINEDEARYLMEDITPKYISEFTEWLGCNILMIKRGGKDTNLYTSGKDIEEINVNFSDKVVDPTGAGDAFDAGFIYGYLNNFSLEKAVEIRNKTAYYKIHGYGVRNLPTLQELRRLFNLNV